ncbi:MAG TPA: 50S ribosomal protein L24 [Ktedonobacterales bacterium]|nr:50S ribosomal protein L24 [Ktedonobacterales bacterium]
MAINPKERKPLHRAKLHVHKGDTVLVLTGKDRGKQATVERTMPRENRVLVEGINIAKKRVRAGRGVLQAGIIEKAMPLHASNVMVVCPSCHEPTRIAHDRVPQGADQKVRSRRICKKCGQPITEQTRS